MKTARAHLAALAALLVSSFARASYGGLPEDPGSFTTQSQTFDVPVSGGVTLSTEVHWPETSGARPLVVLRHGYTSHKENMVGWAEHLATHGFVGVSFESRDPNAIDSTVEGEDMATVTAWLVQRTVDNTSPLFGRIDGARVAVGGHSAGGAAATVAAAKISPQVLVLLDTEDTAEALAAASGIAAPSVALFTEASGCNENGDNRNTFKSVTGPRLGVFVTGATHCDGEDPLDFAGCAYYCGAPTAEHHAELSRYTTAFLEAYLLCDAAAYPYVGGALAQSDGAIEILPETAKLTLPPPACATAPAADAGGPTGPGSGDGGTDAGATADPSAGGAAPGASSANGSGGGGGCAVPTKSPGAAWLVTLVPAAVALLLRHRRRRGR